MVTHHCLYPYKTKQELDFDASCDIVCIGCSTGSQLPHRLILCDSAGTFKHSQGDYSTAIMVLAGLSAFTCVLTANFKEPADAKHANQVNRKAHDIAV